MIGPELFSRSQPFRCSHLKNYKFFRWYKVIWRNWHLRMSIMNQRLKNLSIENFSSQVWICQLRIEVHMIHYTIYLYLCIVLYGALSVFLSWSIHRTLWNIDRHTYVVQMLTDFLFCFFWFWDLISYILFFLTPTV